MVFRLRSYPVPGLPRGDRPGSQTPDGSHEFQAPRKEAGTETVKKVRAKERAGAKALKELAGRI